MKDGVADTHPALVGRQHEMAVLWSRFEESTAGRLQVALVAGEPGIGKTRLLQEVARLSPEVIDLLHTAAIIGRTFNGALLAKVAAQEAEAVEEHQTDLSRVPG